MPHTHEATNEELQIGTARNQETGELVAFLQLPGLAPVVLPAEELLALTGRMLGVAETLLADERSARLIRA